MRMRQISSSGSYIPSNDRGFILVLATPPTRNSGDSLALGVKETVNFRGRQEFSRLRRAGNYRGPLGGTLCVSGALSAVPWPDGGIASAPTSWSKALSFRG